MALTPVLVFDIETIPDIAGLRILRGSDAALSDAEVYAAEIADRQARNKSDFMPLYLQRVLVVSCVFRNAQGLQLRSFVDDEPAGRSREGEIVQAFFDRIERYEPQLVSWNGGGFDLPVLHHRGLRHGVVARKYWDMGGEDRDYRFNNYIGRYHLRHTDLMDVLAMYQPRGSAPLDAMAKLCGFPGKLGMDGSQVYSAYLDGRRDEIRRYCETDTVNTYLLWCRFELMRGNLTAMEYANEIAYVRSAVAAIGEAHWREYLDAWPEDATPAGALRAAPPRAASSESSARPESPERQEFPESPEPAPGDLFETHAVAAVVEVTTQTTETTVYIESSSSAT